MAEHSLENAVWRLEHRLQELMPQLERRDRIEAELRQNLADLRRNLDRIDTLLVDRDRTRDIIEARVNDNAKKINTFDGRLGALEMMLKGSSESTTSKLSMIMRDPFAFLILMMALSVAVKAGINPLDLLK